MLVARRYVMKMVCVRYENGVCIQFFVVNWTTKCVDAWLLATPQSYGT